MYVSIRINFHVGKRFFFFVKMALLLLLTRWRVGWSRRLIIIYVTCKSLIAEYLSDLYVKVCLPAMLREVCTPLLTPIMKYKCVRNVITKADVTRVRRKRRGSRKHILGGGILLFLSTPAVKLLVSNPAYGAMHIRVSHKSFTIHRRSWFATSRNFTIDHAAWPFLSSWPWLLQGNMNFKKILLKHDLWRKSKGAFRLRYSGK
jgi:hypothetical protein